MAPAAPRVEAPPPTAPMAPLRRLTQEQYRNSVRDLLGVRQIGTELAIDEGVAGFFGNTIAPVSELHLEKYGRAAELIARQAVARLPQLLDCPGGASGAAARACGDRFVERFGRRAFRRPLTVEERRLYGQLFEAGAASDLATGARLVVEAMLQSPQFLYLMEPAPAGGVAPVLPFALAARLSYFLWNSTPDDVLLDAAERNQLRTREQVAAQTARMVADPRFADTVASFHLQWLDLTEIGTVEKRGKIYPLFSPALRAAMREETVRFTDLVVRQGQGGPPGAPGGTLQALLTAPFSVVGGPLFELYGLGKREGRAAEWQRVELGPAAHRAGLLTQASVMTAHAHWDKSSLVLRGKLIREKLFCTILPPPPPEVNNTLPQTDPKVSVRERFEEHRNDFGCGKCHRLIDPLGIPFESYDAIGAHRTMDGPAPVEPASEIEGTRGSDGPVKDALELAARLAASDEVRDCVALQWFRYAVGRDEQEADNASLAEIRRVFRASGYRIPALVAAVPLTDSFRYHGAQP